MSGKTTTILAIESSCDETACAILQKNNNGSLANIITETTATSLTKHIETKGVVPEVAAREQVKAIIPAVEITLNKASQRLNYSSTQQLIQTIDAVAVTIGPGLIGSLLIGIESARTLAFAWKKPIIPVHHVLAHQYANFAFDFNSQPTTHNSLRNEKAATKQPSPLQTFSFTNFPALSWVISGGHTNLYYLKSHQKIELIGSTIDDSAGECFDKCARVLGHDYPGGPNIEKLAEQAASSRLTTYNSQLFSLPRPLLHSKDLNTSFSGLKTAFARKFEKLQSEKKFSKESINIHLAQELQTAISDVIIVKTKLALKHFPQLKSILLSGGVAANMTLSQQLKQLAIENNITFHSPPLRLCTDNAVMIGAYALFHPELVTNWKKIVVQM